MQDDFPTARSYSELCYQIYNGQNMWLINTTIWMKQLGPCIAYLYFIASHIDQIICLEAGLCYGINLYLVILTIPALIIS